MRAHLGALSRVYLLKYCTKKDQAGKKVGGVHSQLAGVGQASQGLFQAWPMLYEQQHIFRVTLKASSFRHVPL